MKPRISEHDEFLLSRLLDNDLPPTEADALRRRIEAEPALREAYARLARLDDLLKTRRADRPQIDFKQFHARVTNEVGRAAETESKPLVIRLSRWLAAGVPLAAAAAIALVVILRPAGDKPVSGTGDGPQPPAIVSPVVAVTVQRPEPVPPAPAGAIRVQFTRSQKLAEATWQADAIAAEGRQDGPSIAVVLPEADSQFMPEAWLIDELPM